MKLAHSKRLAQTISLLPQGTIRKLLLMSIFQLFVAFLDIAAILLLGLLTKLGLEYVQNIEVKFPSQITNTLQFENLTFESQFVALSIVVLVLFSLRTGISILGNQKILKYLGSQGALASSKLLDKLLSTEPQYISSKKSQVHLYNVTAGIDNLVLNYLGSLTLLITELFFLLSVMVVLLIAQPLTGICAIVIFSSSFYVIQKITSNKGKELSRELGLSSVVHNQQILETFEIYRELVLRGNLAQATLEIKSRRQQLMMQRAEILFLPNLSKYLFEFVLIIGSFSVASIQLLFTDALAAISSLVMFLAAASRILPSVVRAQSALLYIKQSEGASEITLEQLDEIESNITNQERSDLIDAASNSFTPTISLNKVNFTYDKSSAFSLRDITLEIENGTFVAIVGDSGAGKTTLVDLILGMISPDTGSVRISGLKSLDAAKVWPGLISYVPQDIVIIDGSIRRNITLDSNSSENDIEVLNSLKKAKLIDDVLGMPSQLDEVVGEKGMKLSGGQRQRLGIARALFSKPKLIVFDEATSALDPITERAVSEAIFDKENSGATLIVIAHRLSTVKNADLVIFLEKGRVISMGNFEEVRKSVPKFDQQARLVEL
jgi:ATP-binding cassette, subfamily B, bacterial PglK